MARIIEPVEVYVHCVESSRPIPLSFPNDKLIGPQVRAWCQSHGLSFKSWVTRYEP